MKLNLSTYLPFLFLLALSLSACKDDTLPASPAEEEAGGGVYVSVVVNTGGSNASRVPAPGEDGDLPKQPGTGDENMVHDLTVFFLDDNLNNATTINASAYFSENEITPEASGNITLYTVQKEIEGLYVGNTYHVLVIANAGDLTNEITDIERLRTKTFNKVIVTHDSEQWFLMASEKDSREIEIHANNSEYNPTWVTVDVERMTARVDCAWKEEYTINRDKIKIESAILVNKYIGGTYAFKRVTTSTTDYGIDYLGNEIGDNDTPVGNYVVDPKTLNPPTNNIEDEYEEIYFPTYTNWSAIDWKTPNSEITSEQKGVTYGFLDYTQENVVLADIAATQCAKYCTGIVFKAKYIPVGITAESDGSFYQYNNKFYGTLDQIKKELGVGYIDPADMEGYGITKYEGGICYYTYWIKHADDGDDTKVSPMEYAIVRNNIYQINVTGIHGIGTVTPADYGLYLTCTVADWVSEDEINIEFTDKTAYNGRISPVLVKEDKEEVSENKRAVLVAYSQDNVSRDTQFTFRMQTPRGATWTAHLSNPDDFELVGAYTGVGVGEDASEENGLVTLTIRARKPFEEGTERTTALYITMTVLNYDINEPVAFNQRSDESTLFPGADTYIRIRQVSTTDYDNATTITDDNQDN